MVEAAVEILLDNLKDLENNPDHLIQANKNNIESLKGNLCSIKDFLRDSEKMQRKDERLKRLLRNIRDVVYEVENEIDIFVDHTMPMRNRGKFSIKTGLFRHSKSPSYSLHGTCKKVEELTGQIQKNMEASASRTGDDDADKNENSETPREDVVVGLKDEINAVIGYLSEQTEELDVITIVGMPGIGKTTLARMVFVDPRIRRAFRTRIWVRVSSEFRERYTLLTILRNFIIITEDIKEKNDEELAYEVTSHLKREKFLIVLDDMWATHDWDSLRKAIPNFRNKDSKVLITTCNEEIAQYASRSRQPLKVQALNESESWELLQLKVFLEIKCPPELETVGKLISKQCDGLPLAIVTVAEILARNDLSYGNDINPRKNAWIETCHRTPEYRNKKFYDILPTHLKVCFLYLAAFPYDSKIRAEELIRMWIAEGFIAPPNRNGESLEECAEAYLEALISRNLVKIGDIKADGKVKTCGIHRMLHDFCKTEAGKGKEDFLIETKFVDGKFDPQMSNYHRLAIQSNNSEFISSKPSSSSCPRTRSLLVFSEDVMCSSEEFILLEAFKLLRVLYAKGIKFTHTDFDIFHLLHLRYLALSTDMSVLPAHFSKLWNIQTLVVNTTSHTLDVKPDILGFTQLRHFKTNASADLCKVGKDGNSGKKLQSLANISPESCTKELFQRAHNLKKLGIRGKLSFLLDGKNGSFDSLVALGNLENLKLLNDAHRNPPSKARLSSLPPHDKFPPTVKSLTLAGTFLEWNQMSILQRLEKLEVLKLKDKAFMGRIWEADKDGFPSLKALHIEETDLGIWVASARHFPKLKRLKLHNCHQLQEVPIELADIQSLQLLDLFETRLAAESANRFQQKKKRLHEEKRMDAEEFKLSIYPIS